MECIFCGKPAVPGITAKIGEKEGPTCFECAAETMDIPIEHEHFTFKCSGCHRRIRDIPLFMANRFFHEECLKNILLREDEFKYNPHKIKGALEQASKDAFSVLTAGGIDQLCSICLKFNTQTSLGLPFHGVEPQAISHVCFNCKMGICEHHTAYADPKNILSIDPNLPICSGAWVSSCYSEFEDKVACTAQECDTKHHSFDHERADWDPLINSLQCERCGGYYCNYEHTECPVCVGTACEGCEELIPPDEMLFVQEGMSGYNVCGDCYSSMTCLGCSAVIGEPGEQDTGIEGYCEYCAATELDYFDCEYCHASTAPTEKVKVIYDAAEPDELKDICQECASEDAFQNCPRCGILIEAEGIMYYNVDGRAIKACAGCAPTLYDPHSENPDQLKLFKNPRRY